MTQKHLYMHRLLNESINRREVACMPHKRMHNVCLTVKFIKYRVAYHRNNILVSVLCTVNVQVFAKCIPSLNG